MKKAFMVVAILAANATYALEMDFPVAGYSIPVTEQVVVTVTNTMTPDKIDTRGAWINFDVMQGIDTNSYAIIAPYRWLDATGGVIKAGVSRWTMQDLQNALGAQTGPSLQYLLGFVTNLTTKAVPK